MSMSRICCLHHGQTSTILPCCYSVAFGFLCAPFTCCILASLLTAFLICYFNIVLATLLVVWHMDAVIPVGLSPGPPPPSHQVALCVVSVAESVHTHISHVNHQRPLILQGLVITSCTSGVQSLNLNFCQNQDKDLVFGTRTSYFTCIPHQYKTLSKWYQPLEIEDLAMCYSSIVTVRGISG